MAKLKNLPSQSQIESDIIQGLKDLGGKAERARVIGMLVARWQLTPDELDYCTPGGYVYYQHRIDGIAHNLRREQRIIAPQRGVWQLPKEEAQVEPPPLRPNRHEDLKQKMVDIGGGLCYKARTEEGPEYRHDVLWKRGTHKSPSHVIEICEGGSLPKDFDALHWANENWDATGILVVTDGKDFEKATRRFAGQSRIIAVKAETIDRLHELIMTDVELLKSIFSELPKG